MDSDETPNVPPPAEQDPPTAPPLPTEPPLPDQWSQAPPPSGPGQAPTGGTLGRIIPTQNPPALIAYYCGVFSICLVPAPFAIILGIVGLNRVKKDPSLPGKGHAITGIVLGAGFSLFWIVLILVILRASHGANPFSP
jgi:hypothetical protein